MCDNRIEQISSEDRKVLKGILMDKGRNEVSQHNFIRNMLLVVSFIGVLVGMNLWEECILDIRIGQLGQIISWVLLYAIIIVSVCAGIFNFCYEIKYKPAQQFLCAVHSDNFEIKRVNLISADNSSGENWSTEYYAEIMDENSVCYKERFCFLFKDEFEIGTAFYVSVKLTNGKKGIVVPGKKESPMTWKYGLDMYKKYVQ